MDGELRQAFKRIEERCESIESQVKEVKEALGRDYAVLHGNGHKGLLARMEAVEVWIKGHSDVWKWIISTVIAVAAVAVAALKRG